MKTRDQLKLFALSSALLTLSGQVYANPEVSFDFSQSTGSVAINTTDTIIRTVSATCPTNPDAGNLAGSLIATATTEFDAFANTDGFFIFYWLSRNSVSEDFNHTYDIQLSVPGQTHLPSAAIQRIDSCNEGRTVTYNFMARNVDAADSVSAFRPRLVVTFIKDKN